MDTQEIFQAVSKIIKERYVNNKNIVVNEQMHLELDLGMESLDRIELWVDLEDFYKITIPEEEIKNIRYVSDIVQLVKKYVK